MTELNTYYERLIPTFEVPEIGFGRELAPSPGRSIIIRRIPSCSSVVKFLINVTCETVNEWGNPWNLRPWTGIKSSMVYQAYAYVERARRQTGSSGRSLIALWMCDRSQRLRDVPCAIIFAVAQARLLATVNLRKERLCKESTARPIRLYTRGLPLILHPEFFIARNTHRV